MVGIFSEIDEPLNFNENMGNNMVINVVSLNDVRFLRKLLFKKVFSYNIIILILYIILLLAIILNSDLNISYLLHVIMKQNI